MDTIDTTTQVALGGEAIEHVAVTPPVHAEGEGTTVHTEGEGTTAHVEGGEQTTIIEGGEVAHEVVEGAAPANGEATPAAPSGERRKSRRNRNRNRKNRSEGSNAAPSGERSDVWTEFETAHKAGSSMQVQIDSFQFKGERKTGLNAFKKGVRIFIPLGELAAQAQPDMMVQTRTREWVRITSCDRHKHNVVASMRLGLTPEQIAEEAAERAVKAERGRKRIAYFESLNVDDWIENATVVEKRVEGEKVSYTIMLNEALEFVGRLPEKAVRFAPGTRTPIDLPEGSAIEVRVSHKDDERKRVALSMLQPPNPNRPKREGDGKGEQRGGGRPGGGERRDNRGHGNGHGGNAQTRGEDRVVHSTDPTHELNTGGKSGRNKTANKPATAPKVVGEAKSVGEWHTFTTDSGSFDVKTTRQMRGCNNNKLVGFAMQVRDAFVAALKEGKPVDEAKQIAIAAVTPAKPELVEAVVVPASAPVEGGEAHVEAPAEVEVEAAQVEGEHTEAAAEVAHEKAAE